MEERATLLVAAQPNPDEREAMRSYLESVMPLFVAAGGELVARLMVDDVISGTRNFAMMLVMDFESKDTIQSVFASEASKDLLPLREKGFKNMDILLASGM